MNQDIRELMLSDLAHFGKSFWRNEEVGEKRVNFLLSLVTAIVAGLVALATSDFASKAPQEARYLASGALAGVLVVGLVTYLRVLRRNEVTDEYVDVIKYIRKRFHEASMFDEEYKLPLDAKERSAWRGGLSTMVAAINSLILAYLVAILIWPGTWVLAAAVFGFALGMALQAILNKLSQKGKT